MRKLFACVGLLLFMSSTAWVQANSLVDKIDEAIAPYVDSHLFSGSVLVAKSGDVIYEKGFGFANKEWEALNTPQTKFGLGSLSKTLTATLTMKLVQEGKLNLTDTVDNYLNEYPVEKGKKITIHHLLSHSSGIPNYFRIPGWFTGDFRREISDEEFIKVLGRLALDFKPGERYMYSNAGYFLLSKIIEKAAGISYYHALDLYILSPLKLSNTGYHSPTKLLDKRASGYQWGNEGGFKNQNYINNSLFRGAGALYSTVSDLFKFEQALYGELVLNSKNKEEMFSPENSYGWKIVRWPLDNKGATTNVMTYSGQLMGFSSMLTRFVDDKHTIILLTNSAISNLERQYITAEIASILYGLSDSEPKETATLALAKAMAEGRLEQQIKIFAAQKDKIQFDENRLNSLAQQVLWSGSTSPAIKLYQFSHDIHPHSPVALAGLGESFEQLGEGEKALKYFKLALKSAPSNGYYQSRVRELESAGKRK